MPTNRDYNRLRKDIDACYGALPDQEAADIYAEAAELYTGAGSIRAGTRVIAIQRILASATKLTSYRQNNSQENLSDVAKNVGLLLDVWQEALDKALLAEQQANGSAPNQSMSVRVCSVW